MIREGQGNAARTSRRLGLRIRQLRWKIMLPYAALTCVFAVLGSFLVTRLVTHSVDERFTGQLVEAGRVVSDAVVRRERQQLDAMQQLATIDGLPDAVADSSSATLAQIVDPEVAAAQAERVEVLDATGTRVYGARLTDATTLSYAPIQSRTNYGEWSIVTDVLRGKSDQFGDKWAQLVWTDDGPAIYSAGPLRDAAGTIRGVILVGSSLGSLLPILKSDALAEVSLYDIEGRPFGTTFRLSPSEGAAIVPTTPIGASQSFEGYRERRGLFGRDYDLLWGDLRLRNEVVGRYSVALPASAVAGAGTTALWQMTVLFGGVTICVIALGWYLARRITSPLGRLVDAARALSSGDLTARSGVRGADEIGVLASTFDVMAEKMQHQQMATIGALASAIDARDPYTAGHSVRVGNLSVELGRELGLSRADLYQLQIGGFLHDVGKIGVRDSVLLKQGDLNDAERQLIEQHPEIGLKILAAVDLQPAVLEIVGRHHERLDGSGYPGSFVGDQISIFPRITAVADIYDALTTHRPYKSALEPVEALQMLRRQSMEGLVDPEVVSTLQRIARAWEDVRRADLAARLATAAPEQGRRSA